MSYPLLDDKEFFQKLLSKKEFYQYKKDGDVGESMQTNKLNLYAHQLFIRNFINPNTDYKRILLLYMTGTGKCFGLNTQILMYNNSVKNVQDIVPGDKLMGDDSTPRTVLSLARGREIMVRIKPETYESFTCNLSHLLCLIDTNGAKVVLTVKEYLASDQKYYLYTKVLHNGESYTSRWARLEQIVKNLPYAIRRGQRCKVIKHDTAAIYKLARSIAAKCELSLGVLYLYSLENTPIEFDIEITGYDDYYGFEITGNRMFFLANYIITHNTLAACSIANNFIQLYRRLYNIAMIETEKRNYIELDKMTPSVFIFGFSGPKRAFENELLKYPEFGFVTLSEREELTKLQKVATNGGADDQERYKEYRSMLRKRLYTKHKGGFYKFYGYREFVNRLFITTEKDLNEMVLQTRNSTEPLVALVARYVKSGKLYVNKDLLAQFNNSLIICDEIHNTYNTNMKNNAGIAIQYVLDIIPSLRAVFMTATPLNNSPSEIVDVINYLVPQKVQRKDFTKIDDETLRKIGELTMGRVSFIQDSNVKYYPSREFNGATVQLPRDVEGYNSLPYLKFIECPMTQIHQATYEEMLRSEFATGATPGENGESIEKGEKGENGEDGEVEEFPGGTRLPADGYTILDMVFPNPDTSKPIGIYRTGDIRNKLFGASPAWKDEQQIITKKAQGYNIIGGEFLHLDTLKTYSSKYYKMMKIILDLIGAANGDPEKSKKMLVYHNMVINTGVVLIQEIFTANGFIDETSEPNDNTICCICGVKFIDHLQDQKHSFIPARFLIVHTYISDKSTIGLTLNKFNTYSNRFGHDYMILIGPKIISESYHITDCQVCIITSMPTNIPTLIQIFGRCVRNKSHENLPPLLNKVTCYILLSTINKDYPFTDNISIETYRWLYKLMDYTLIQKIEQEMNRRAIDADIHRETNFTTDFSQDPALGYLYFDPLYEIPNLMAPGLDVSVERPSLALNTVDLSTFTSYGYYKDEIDSITFIIKNLFLKSSIWTYDKLWLNVQSPPINLEQNTKLFSEKNFVIALDNLVNNKYNINYSMRSEKLENIEKFFDPEQRYIFHDKTKYTVTHIDKYYILFPVLQKQQFTVDNFRQVANKFLAKYPSAIEYTAIDVGYYNNPPTINNYKTVDVAEFIEKNKSVLINKQTRDAFVAKYEKAESLINMLMDYPILFQMKMIEEAIIAYERGNQTTLHEKIISLFHDFGAIIFTNEILKYKDIAKNFTLDKNRPIGYLTRNSIKLYDNHWFEINKISMNKQNNYIENDIIIGHFDEKNDEIKFKLRKPYHLTKDKIKKDHKIRKMGEKNNSFNLTSNVDTRLVERGINCETKNKSELMQIAADVGVSLSKVEKTNLKMKNICKLIRSNLIAHEIAERKGKTRVKWLYGFWDEI